MMVRGEYTEDRAERARQVQLIGERFVMRDGLGHRAVDANHPQRAEEYFRRLLVTHVRPWPSSAFLRKPPEREQPPPGSRACARRRRARSTVPARLERSACRGKSVTATSRRTA